MGRKKGNPDSAKVIKHIEEAYMMLILQPAMDSFLNAFFKAFGREDLVNSKIRTNVGMDGYPSDDCIAEKIRAFNVVDNSLYEHVCEHYKSWEDGLFQRLLRLEWIIIQ